VIKDGSFYFGPYTSGLMVKTLIILIRQLYQLRTCTLNLTEENINAGKFKVCLEYHIGNCRAPCVGYESETEYSESIRQIRDILKGNISTVIDHLKKRMITSSNELRFEEAQVLKDKIDILSKFQSRSTIVSSTIKNVDVFGYAEEPARAFACD
jgi:excinuclease ABC subunit C